MNRLGAIGCVLVMTACGPAFTVGETASALVVDGGAELEAGDSFADAKRADDAEQLDQVDAGEVLDAEQLDQVDAGEVLDAGNAHLDAGEVLVEAGNAHLDAGEVLEAGNAHLDAGETVEAAADADVPDVRTAPPPYDGPCTPLECPACAANEPPCCNAIGVCSCLVGPICR